jgi:hypothetical protein
MPYTTKVFGLFSFQQPTSYATIATTMRQQTEQELAKQPAPITTADNSDSINRSTEDNGNEQTYHDRSSNDNNLSSRYMMSFKKVVLIHSRV